MGRASLFRIVYFLLGTVCALTLIIVAIGGSTAKWFVRKDIKKYGELYDCCKISFFKIPLPAIAYPYEVPDHSLYESEIIFTGDSYFGKNYGKFFEERTGVTTYTIWRKSGQNPLEALDELQYKPNGKQKYLVFESVERELQHGLLNNKEPLSLAEQFNQKIKKYLISADRLEFFVCENSIVSELLEFRNTLRFVVLKDISDLTPVYSVDPPMLHLRRSVNGNRRIKTDEDIEEMAEKIEEIAMALQQRYGLKMIFFPIPNKYSLYGYDYNKYDYNTHGESYDNFLPKLQKQLEERGVLSLDLYHKFLNSKEPVAEPTHDHWNARGMMLGMDMLVSLYNDEEMKIRSLFDNHGQND